MFEPAQIARFALSEFRRGLDGLTDDEARVRMRKADGTEMNAISWTACHVARPLAAPPARAAPLPLRLR